jgi:GcrA cell cycle regulator
MTVEVSLYRHKNQNGTCFQWTEARVDVLKKLWADGYSGTQIGLRLGVTRCAVLGKVDRLGLPKRLEHTYTRRGGHLVGKPRRKSAKEKAYQLPDSEGKYLKVATAPNFHKEPLPPEPVRPDKLVSFADLQDDQCRFIYGDPRTKDHGFCGCKKAPGLSYCAGHAYGEKGCFAGLPLPKRRRPDNRPIHTLNRMITPIAFEVLE